MDKVLRVAYFPDSFLEVNGVAMTSQKFLQFAKKNRYPILCVHAGDRTEVSHDGSVTYLSLKRSFASINLDEDLSFDPLFFRHAKRVLRELDRFEPDALHITGLNDVSIIGAIMARMRRIPSVGSWHTNVHQFAARRLTRLLGFLPASISSRLINVTEKAIRAGAILYYRMPKVVLAPNQELLDWLVRDKNRKVFLMTRGVDTDVFSPEARTVCDDVIRLGFVGRLRAEKNVRLLVDLEKELIRNEKLNFKFIIVGEGNEKEFLTQNMTTAEFTGFLKGKQLSEAYANMDVFVFPSETETFGNVVQEANASGVPAIVSDRGGPKFIVRHGETGYIAESFGDYARYLIELIDEPEKLVRMKQEARKFAFAQSWDSVFESVYRAYATAIKVQAEETAKS